MAQSSYRPSVHPVAIISRQFCAPYPVDLTIASKLLTINKGDFTATDVNGNVMFRIKGRFFTLHGRHILLDAARNPMLTFQHKILTAHKRWQVFRGDTTAEKDLLFSVKKSSLIQFKTQLDVFLAGNTNEDVCDFKIKGSWGDRSCTIYLGNTLTIIAQMHKNNIIGRDRFAVTVYPNVDYAFIVALVVVLEEIHDDRHRHIGPALAP
ncbi:hypothetical protein RHGRI_015614 [Rhododendron griersonianum]|uniref:Protein LURP-one-related 10-like n=1 Tax=Rhododendron griersonianum TaxID=479676 RepID=A0AAV6KEJ0_9ERIC|nr:hypothetical protein RHGRI_015614 [Rhododendron griersonianum]